MLVVCEVGVGVYLGEVDYVEYDFGIVDGEFL